MSYLAIITIDDEHQMKYWYPSTTTDDAARARLYADMRMNGAMFGEVYECRTVSIIVYNDWTGEYDEIRGEGRNDEVRF